MARAKLKAPFPYFGGKSRVAALVWDRFGDVDNFCEPFMGSGAVLLARPHAPRIETVNDADSMVANFWRATQHDPEAVAVYADGPVNEVDLHSRHRWLVLSDDAAEFRRRMRTEHDYYNAKVAGYWCWGLCCWIGSGWCSVDDSVASQRPNLNGGPGGAVSNSGVPCTPELVVRGQDNRKPRIDGGPGQFGHGVHAGGQIPSVSAPGCGVDAAAGSKRPKLSGGTPGSGALGTGVHANGAKLSEKIPRLTGARHYGGLAIHAGVIPEQPTGRPQLADTYARGRGVNGNDQAETCAARRAWLIDWFGRLRDRLRTVRVCCGDWSRVCSSESTTTRLGLTGVFLDPPYSFEAKRNNKLYSQESGTVAHEVRAWCLEHGGDPQMRIVLCGYEGEGHEELEASGWDVVEWKAPGGYGNRSETGRENAKRERLWTSPYCVKNDLPLFGV